LLNIAIEIYCIPFSQGDHSFLKSCRSAHKQARPGIAGLDFATVSYRVHRFDRDTVKLLNRFPDLDLVGRPGNDETVTIEFIASLVIFSVTIGLSKIFIT